MSKYLNAIPLNMMLGYTGKGSYLLNLQVPERQSTVPIIIGRHEASMLIIETSDESTPRPMTHQLIGSICEAFTLEIEEVRIDRFDSGIFYCSLIISDGFNVKNIDSRASDAILLAINNNCPIRINSAIVDEIGIDDDAIEREQEQETGKELSQMSLPELEELLHECEENEDYEQAEKINQYIKQLQNGIQTED